MHPNLSIIPLSATPEDIIFYFYLFARFSGLFLISPLFSNHLLPGRTRIFLTLFTTLIIGTALWDDYRGPNPKYEISNLTEGSELSLISIGLISAGELAVGYLIGFAFTIIYEAMLLAGQVVGVMAGLSMSEILDPISQLPQGLVGQLLSALTTLLILTLDLHHTFIRVTAESFSILPIASYHLSHEFLGAVEQGTGRLFHHGMQVAVIPFAVLSLITVGLGFVARVMPEMNIFMVGFPLKILVGFYSLILTVHYFPVLLQHAFAEYHNLAELILRYISDQP